MNKGIPSFLIRRLAGEVIEIEEESPVGLPPMLERQRKNSIRNLGEKWLLHPCHAPRRGHYNNQGMLISEGEI